MLSQDSAKQAFSGKKILVTGGLGSIGAEITRQLLACNPELIRILDNRETELFYSRQSFLDRSQVEYFFGDVRDKERVDEATAGIDIVFHAAAMKHVIVCEQDPAEAVKTNVLGTQNVIKSSFQHNVKKLIHISTDKVVNPTNVMGATKLLAERLVSAMCKNNNGNTRVGIVRFGNVLSSRGSVLEIWDKQIAAGEKIYITNPDMTRFFMSIPESVKLVFTAMKYTGDGETCILKMPSVRIGDLAQAYLKVKGLPQDHYKIIGQKPGEKIHEGLLFEEESGFLMENPEMFVRLPLRAELETRRRKFESMGFTRSTLTSFSSKDKSTLINISDIEKILAQIV